MTKEKWEDVKSMIEEKFTVLDRYVEDLLPEEGRGVREVVEFVSPMGDMRIQRTEKAKVEEKKTIYSKRAGSHTSVEYIYSDTETVATVEVFRKNPHSEEWEKIQSESFLA